jgi:hypothetical protein
MLQVEAIGIEEEQEQEEEGGGRDDDGSQPFLHTE